MDNIITQEQVDDYCVSLMADEHAAGPLPRIVTAPSLTGATSNRATLCSIRRSAMSTLSTTLAAAAYYDHSLRQQIQQRGRDWKSWFRNDWQVGLKKHIIYCPAEYGI